MNRRIFYFDKSSMEKACEKVKEFCAGVADDDRFKIVSPRLNVYKIPGDIDSKKSILFIESNQSSCIDYVNKLIREYSWKDKGVEGFEEAQGGTFESSKVEATEECEVEIRMVGLAKVKASEEVDTLSKAQKYYADLVKRANDNYDINKLESPGVQPSKSEGIKTPADFCRGTADESLRFALKAEEVSLQSNNMHEILENAKQIYDLLKGVSSHFVDGKSLGGFNDKP